MADTDYAVALSVKGQSLYVQSVILDSASGNELTGGLTSLAATVSKDGGAFASCTNAPAEIGTTGYVSVLLTATEMNANAIIVRFTASNTGAMAGRAFVYPLVLSEEDGSWDAQTVKRVEQAILQGTAYSLNKVSITGANEQGVGTITLYKRDGATAWLTGEASDNGVATDKGTLS